MIDVIAALSLAGAAAKTENPAQLFEDAKVLYGVYKNKPDPKTIDLKTVVPALYRVSAVANDLIKDPNQLKNVTDLLASIA